MLTLGSLCTGAGMLDMAVEAVLGPLRRTWHSENDPDATAVLTAHHPDVPNLGDLTTVDWNSVEPVDILTAGFPCQDVSAAGRRAGIAPDTRSGLWSHIAHAINILQPQLVVIENVLGLLSARADRNLGPEHEDMETAGRDALRAAGAVLGDLADVGFDAEWTTLTASSIGAPHKRARVFLIAWPAGHPPHLGAVPAGRPGDTGRRGLELLPTPNAALGRGTGFPSTGTATARRASGRRFLDDAISLLPTPAAARSGRQCSASDGAAIRPSLDSITHLLPTPRATDGTKGGPNQRGSSGDLMLPSAVVQLLPTPTVQHSARNATATRTAPKPTTCTTSWTLADVAYADRWGAYAPAVARWEAITGRVAPEPTEPGRTGNPRLSARFVEWMLGLPAGHVTDHVGRNPALKICGNGVVWQQGAAALHHLLNRI